MTKEARKAEALNTLKKVKDIYNRDMSDILTAGFYSEFMALVVEQMKQIEKM